MESRTVRDILKSVGNAAREVALETLWPTRCAVCDAPGEQVLCERCRRELAFIDSCTACPVCGAPFGRLQCTQCNDVMLASMGLDALPVDAMVHAAVLNEAARRIVTIYKDGDERRLVEAMAEILARYVSPDRAREGYALTYIPATAASLRRRGFDHGREIAQALSRRTGLPCLGLFARPDARDQRKLGRRERIANMAERLIVAPGTEVPPAVLVVDDVCTTGATLFAAAAALRRAGARQVQALTFGWAGGA